MKQMGGGGFHIQKDVLEVIRWDWDLAILHPPCTYLNVAANKYYDPSWERLNGDGKIFGSGRLEAREKAVQFFKDLWTCNIPRVCIENPVGIMPSRGMPATQYIQPYQFGEDASKKTGLWLRNLPKLKPTRYIPPKIYCHTHKMVSCPGSDLFGAECKTSERWANQSLETASDNRSFIDGDGSSRSITYQGIADAMANQWQF